LQAFWPLHPCVAPLQMPFPLQSFTPTHCTGRDRAALPAIPTAGARVVASMLAIAAPVVLPFFMVALSAASRPRLSTILRLG
jgi:hypothetical protein